ncbi:MAG: mechanosensitive ion channel family protein [Planctomycetaceae bacterium]|nr:mechanosensitive ion channel family protein [Planctomycetaceae bacterium]
MLQAAATDDQPLNPTSLLHRAEQFGLTSDRILYHGQQLVLVLVVIFAGWVVAGLLARTVRISLEKAKLEETLTLFFTQAARWFVLVLTGLSVLSLFGVETTSLAAVVGAGSLAIGLAWQGALSNFAAGIMLLVFRPYRVGDMVNVNGTLGRVKELELFTTTMDTTDNRRFIVPNASIFGSTIENLSHHQQRRVEVAVGVSYQADIDHTRVVLREAVASVTGVLADPEPVIYLVELGNSTVNWSVRAWAPTADYWSIRDQLTRAVKIHLDAAGVQIAFPQLHVHLEQL